MISNQKDLIINNFYILKSYCELIVPKEDFIPETIFLSYNIDFDYSVKKHKGSKSFKILTNIKINNPVISPGYTINIESIGEFTLNSDNLSEYDKEHLVNFTAVEKCIEYIRGFIATITAQYPLGKYFLGYIDMEFIYRTKLEKIKKIKNSDYKIKKN